MRSPDGPPARARRLDRGLRRHRVRGGARPTRRCTAERVRKRGEAIACQPEKRTASPQPTLLFSPIAGSNISSGMPEPTLPRSSRPTPRPSRRARAFPNPILATHENLAVTMAHGYAMVSRKIPAVMVHVSVGTANMVCAAMNAARENIAILLTAGTLAHHGRRPARLARRLYPLGAGNVRPGRHDPGIGQMGL